MPAPIDRPRKELADVAFPDATWTSFDRYDRYGAIARAVRATLGEGRHRVLDVGDAAGHLSLFDPGLQVVGLDLEPAADRLPGAVPLRGDGASLPFADDTFDAVVSSDVLEHVPADDRPPFLAELRRVSRDIVVVAAPFDTPGVAGVEELVRRYALLALGAEQPQLEEHRERGLPDLGATAAALGRDGWPVVTVGNGNLWDWLLSMVLRFQVESRPALQPLSGGYDLLHNMALAGRSAEGPWYRHLVAARPSGAVDLGDDAGGPAEPSTDESLALLAGLIAAHSTEVVRQDTVPRLDALAAELAAAQRRVDELATRLDHVVGQNADLRSRLEELFVVQMEVNGPLLGFLRRAQRFRRR